MGLFGGVVGKIWNLVLVTISFRYLLDIHVEIR